MEKQNTTTTSAKSRATTKNYITIGGTRYSLRTTMGALLEFKSQTGREVTEMAQGSISDTLVFVYSLAKSASIADKRDFPFADPAEFAAHITPEDMSRLDVGF